jgi:hypothetical protein
MTNGQFPNKVNVVQSRTHIVLTKEHQCIPTATQISRFIATFSGVRSQYVWLSDELHFFDG